MLTNNYSRDQYFMEGFATAMRTKLRPTDREKASYNWLPLSTVKPTSARKVATLYSHVDIQVINATWLNVTPTISTNSSGAAPNALWLTSSKKG